MNRRAQLTDWVEAQHRGQIIKKTDEPYFEHLLTVALSSSNAAALTYEIGLCHDLLEKTGTTTAALGKALGGFGYNPDETSHILSCVIELTDVFTKKAFTDLSKKERKAREEARLVTISPDAQSVKYADLLYNANWMIEHDQEHAKNYLTRKLVLINSMTDGDQVMCKQTQLRFRELLGSL